MSSNINVSPSPLAGEGWGEGAQATTSEVDNIAIRVSNLSKCYTLYDAPRDRLKQFVLPRLQRVVGKPPKNYYREFWALKDVSFEVKKGETLGIIGRNGAGKSTLLQIISGTLAPNSGSVELNGRVAALLELGAGFNPDFTGRENVYMSGSVLGLSKEEIDARFNEIAGFADIGDFITQPVKTYSSGMYVRLAFAVSACVNPDVLIIDEALAVGDVKFQAKCFRRFEELLSRGTTIVLVTHSTEQISRHCSNAILLESGSKYMEGAPKDVANCYLDLLFGVDRKRHEYAGTFNNLSLKLNADDSTLLKDTFEKRSGYNSHEYRWGNREAEITDFMVTTDGKNHSTHLAAGAETLVIIWVRFHESVATPIYGLTIKTPDGVTVYGCNSRDYSGGPLVSSVAPGHLMRAAFRLKQCLGTGDYLISVGVAEDRFGNIVPLDRRYDAIHVKVQNNSSRSFGLADFNMQVEVSRE